jgi:hypothetical protein
MRATADERPRAATQIPSQVVWLYVRQTPDTATIPGGVSATCYAPVVSHVRLRSQMTMCHSVGVPEQDARPRQPQTCVMLPNQPLNTPTAPADNVSAFIWPLFKSDIARRSLLQHYLDHYRTTAD